MKSRAIGRILAATSAGACGLVFASCTVAPSSGISLDITAPEGVLDTATSVTLSVFAAEGHTCDPATGRPDSIPADATTFPLEKVCDGAWCTTVSLPIDKKDRVFSVDVSDASGPTASGCAIAKIDKDPVAVDITVVRYVPPLCCNNGVLETGESCDPGVTTDAECSTVTPTETCNADCTAVSVPVDRPLGGPPPAVNAKFDLSLAFAGGNGMLKDGLRAAFSDLAIASNQDVGVRFLTPSLTAIKTPAPFANALKLPLLCTNPTGAGAARQQRSPAIAAFGADSMVAAYLSDEMVPGQFNAFLTKLGPSGCAENAALLLNTTPNGVNDPDVATSGSTALAVWEQGGTIFGRLYDGSALGAAAFTIAQGNTPSVAASSLGFVVAYHGADAADDDGIYVAPVSLTGTPGSPEVVNLKTTGPQDQPDIAAFPDGRYAVAFHSGLDVFMQRYSAAGGPVQGDQDAPLDAAGSNDRSRPVVASGTSPTVGEFYLFAWQSDTGEIFGRLAGVSAGFLFNPINGQNTEFVASPVGDPGARSNPAVAIGGAGTMVVGWQDTAAEHPGVFARPLPLPY